MPRSRKEKLLVGPSLSQLLPLESAWPCFTALRTASPELFPALHRRTAPAQDAGLVSHPSRRHERAHSVAESPRRNPSH